MQLDYLGYLPLDFRWLLLFFGWLCYVMLHVFPLYSHVCYPDSIRVESTNYKGSKAVFVSGIFLDEFDKPAPYSTRANGRLWRAPWKGGDIPVGENPTRQFLLQPEAIRAVMEVTKWLKPLV